jgi:hypothetical protein
MQWLMICSSGTIHIMNTSGNYIFFILGLYVWITFPLYIYKCIYSVHWPCCTHGCAPAQSCDICRLGPNEFDFNWLISLYEL